MCKCLRCLDQSSNVSHEPETMQRNAY